ncbi:MAG: hypothetical protein KY466_00730 [Gemmatimonadetes bacterium]|nr:hypothetical protein [Gemmatimonadota bacterium]
MHRRSTPFLLLLGVGCGDGAEGGSSWRVEVDTLASGAVRVVNVPPAEGASPTLVAEEELRIGTVYGPGPASFGLIRSLAVLPDGRIAVADGQAEEVRLFGRDGAHLRTFGGEGAGPGELRGSQGVHVDHEGLLRVAEQGNARLSVFDPDGGFVRSHPLRLHSYGGRGPWRAVMDSVGRTLVASSGQYGEGRFWRMLRVYDPGMRQVDSIPYDEYTETITTGDPDGAWRIPLGRGGWTFRGVPFYNVPRETMDPSGDFWSSAAGTPGLEIARWSPAGDTSLVFESRRPAVAVTPSERDSAIAAVQKSLESVPNPRVLDYSRIPSTKPPLHGLSLDDRGRVWVRLTAPGEDSTVYDIFDRSGRHAATALVPAAVDAWIPPLVRGDTLWAVVTDAMEVQHVIRAALRPSADVDA